MALNKATHWGSKVENPVVTSHVFWLNGDDSKWICIQAKPKECFSEVEIFVLGFAESAAFGLGEPADQRGQLLDSRPYPYTGSSPGGCWRPDQLQANFHGISGLKIQALLKPNAL